MIHIIQLYFKNAELWPINLIVIIKKLRNFRLILIFLFIIFQVALNYIEIKFIFLNNFSIEYYIFSIKLIFNLVKHHKKFQKCLFF